MTIYGQKNMFNTYKKIVDYKSSDKDIYRKKI